MTERPEPPTWDDLKDLIRWFAILFGEPAALFRTRKVLRDHGLRIRGWLLALESIARALLIVMAGELAKAEPPTRKAKPARSSKPAPPKDDVTSDAEDDSTRWTGLSFACVPPKRAAHARAAGRRQPPRPIATHRLALRFEALIRVAEAPERYAARMARVLHARPKLAFRILRRPKPLACQAYPRHDVEDAQDYAWLVMDTG